jgi:hypothetical protein
VGPVSAGWVPPSQLVSACKALHFFEKEKNDCTLIIRCKNFVHRMRVDRGQLGKLIKALVCVSRHGRIYAWLYTVAEDEPKWLAGGTVSKQCRNYVFYAARRYGAGHSWPYRTLRH